MSQADDLYRELNVWMWDGPTVVADRVIDGALLTIDHTPQDRRPRAPWRLPTMPFPYRLALVAMLILATVGATLVVGGRLTFDQAAGREIVVAADGSADARTITEALDLAVDGDVILVRPGTYAESLTIDKDITLRGDGDPSAVVIDFSAGDGPTTVMPGVGEALPSVPYGIVLERSDAIISDLTVHGPAAGAALKIVGGAPVIESVVITAEQPSAGAADDRRTSFGIYEGSTAVIRDSAWDGYIKVDRSSPLFEHNTISAGNGQSSSWLTVDFPESDPVVRSNTLLGGASLALCCGASGTIEDNDVVGGFVSAQSQADVVIRGNRIRASGEAGCVACDTRGIAIWQNETSQGSPDSLPLIEGNDVIGMDVGVQTQGYGVNAVVRGNTLVKNNTGVLLDATAGGDISGNTIRDGGAGIVINTGSSPTVTGNVVASNERGIVLANGAKPALSGNAVCGNGTDLQVEGKPVSAMDGVSVCPSPPAASTTP
jgi:parallel beta-helix repeat protein